MPKEEDHSERRAPEASAPSEAAQAAQACADPKGRAARLVRVSGLVQGVGFRPTVYRIAVELGLSGEVFNDADGVGVFLEGSTAALDAFAPALLAQKPPLARIDRILETEAEPRGSVSFVITPSRQGGRVHTAITADAAVCRACLTELFTPADRRYRYAFTNCTHCGPRFTITHSLPYDRPQTSMAAFPMCPACRAEYDDPLDRRFHAQPNACPVCGPQLRLLDRTGEPIECDPIEEAVHRLKRGEILALKGIGGFHLVCDATNPDAVQTLKTRKRRSEKPLAVMLANLASARRYATVTDTEAQALASRSAPIVLLRRREDAPNALSGVADGLSDLGVMLPYTPLHALLFHEWIGRPEGIEWLDRDPHPAVLVMTSANVSGDPLVIDNDEALAELADIADVFLVHNREILERCDDSVVREALCADASGELRPRLLPVRRSRGYAPESIPLSALSCDADSERPVSVLALGPYLKNTACLTRGAEAFFTQHIGDLGNRRELEALESAAAHLEKIIDAAPTALACDAHPDFMSTQLAKKLARERGLPLFEIAHHAAHIGAVMAAEKLCEPVLGLAIDGVGLGPENGIWGGELLAVGPEGFSRVGRLRPLPLPGGDRAAREPWRMGAAVLVELGRPHHIERLFPNERFSAQMGELCRSPWTPKTSSLGRVIDAAASLLGLATVQFDEATAAMRLESAADRAPEIRERVLKNIAETPSPEGVALDSPELSLLPLFERLRLGRRRGEPVPVLAAQFLVELSLALADWTDRATRRHPIRLGAERRGERPIAALSGGCFINRTIASIVTARLASRGFDPRLPEGIPPGDGGVSLGEAWLAKLALAAGRKDYPFLGDACAGKRP